MKPEQANAYLSKLMNGEVVLTETTEVESFNRFRKMHGSVLEAQKRLERAQQEFEQAKVDLIRAEGKRESFADVLIEAESIRQEATREAAAKEAGEASLTPEQQASNARVLEMLKGVEMAPARSKRP